MVTAGALHQPQQQYPKEKGECHRQQQARRVRSSVLDQIPGVGEKRRAQLLKHFKSVKNIRAASREQLEGVVPKNTAKAVYDYFQTDGKARP